MKMAFAYTGTGYGYHHGFLYYFNPKLSWGLDATYLKGEVGEVPVKNHIRYEQYSFAAYLSREVLSNKNNFFIEAFGGVKSGYDIIVEKELGERYADYPLYFTAGATSKLYISKNFALLAKTEYAIGKSIISRAYWQSCVGINYTITGYTKDKKINKI